VYEVGNAPDREVRMKRKLAVAAGTVLLLASLPATAALQNELFTARRAGPMRLGDTTIGKLKRWFGEPDAEEKITRGCVKVWRVRWGWYLKAFGIKHPNGGRRLTETWVRQRTITSKKHGDLTMHTRKGLRVGDRVRKLKRLYPNYQRFRINGKNFYELKPIEEAHPRLMAIGRDRRVRALINRPYEYC
jgi:hypothetical protein